MLRTFYAYHRKTSIGLVFAVYTAFFFVNIFYNFNSRIRFHYTNGTGSAQTITKKNQVIKQGGLSDENKAKLNKRFQPVEVDYLLPDLLPAPVAYKTVKQQAATDDGHLHTQYLQHHYLRGPPVNG